MKTRNNQLVDVTISSLPNSIQMFPKMQTCLCRAAIRDAHTRVDSRLYRKLGVFPQVLAR